MNILTASRQTPLLGSYQSSWNLNDLLLAQLTSLMVTSSNPWNAKPQPVSSTHAESNFDQDTMYKKVKRNEDTPALQLTNRDTLIQKTKVKSKQPEMKFRIAPRDVIVIDEDEDQDCLMIDNLSTYPAQICQTSSCFNPILSYPSQQLKLITENSSSVNVNPNLLVKEPELIIIDNDDKEQLTCQSTTLTRQDSLSDCSENAGIQNQNQNSLEETTSFNMMQCARILRCELSSINKKQRKLRQVKLVWQPDCCESEEVKLWVEEIQKTIGVEIISLEKVLKTMKNFDMNLKTALGGIRRNKAQYKDYFRMKRLNQFHY